MKTKEEINMTIKYQSTIVSTRFVRTEKFTSKGEFSRYGKFKDVAISTLSCGHAKRLSEIKVKDDGFCFCFDCKYEDGK